MKIKGKLNNKNYLYFLGGFVAEGGINLIDNRTNPLITITSGFKKIGGSVVNIYSSIVDKLNPYNYFNTTTETTNQFKRFMQVQENPVTANRRLYPFTEVNPFLPWYKQLKITYIGESVSEALQRFKDQEMCEHLYNSLKVSKGKLSSVIGGSPVSTPGSITPARWSASVGLGLTTNKLTDTLEHLNLENRFKDITPVPSGVSTSNADFLERVKSVLPETSEWKNHVSVKDTSVDEFYKKFRSTAGQSSKTTLEDLDIAVD